MKPSAANLRGRAQRIAGRTSRAADPGAGLPA